jgi:dGTP triphosphohydrolase
MNAMLERQLARLDYIDPRDLLRSIEPTVVGVLQHPNEVRGLTDHQRNDYIQKHQAAFLSLFMKQIAGPNANITVALKEADDYDCVIRAIDAGGGTAYKLVQLKQLVNHQVDDNIDLQTLINRLPIKCASSGDLVVAIWTNRDIELDFSQLDLSRLRVEQLWLFGDSVDGAVTLDGGFVSDLIAGVRWSCVMRNLQPLGKQVRFTPRGA